MVTGAEMKPRLRASAVCELDGKLLLVRLRDPVSGVEALFPPGGGVEADEPPDATAARETLEETGVRVRVDPASAIVERYPFTWAGVDYDVTTHYFAASVDGPPLAELPKVVDADYNLGAVWLPTTEALEGLAVPPVIAAAVARVLRRARLAEWIRDANFDGPAATLVGIHQQFRRAAGHLSSLSDRGQIARAFAPLASVLHHHHHAEEVMLFPLVEGRTGRAPARLVSDHEELTAAIKAVEASFSAEAIARFSRVLDEHLDREELLVVPVLLSISPHEAWAMIEGR